MGIEEREMEKRYVDVDGMSLSPIVEVSRLNDHTGEAIFLIGEADMTDNPHTCEHKVYRRDEIGWYQRVDTCKGMFGWAEHECSETGVEEVALVGGDDLDPADYEMVSVCWKHGMENYNWEWL